MKIKRLTFLLLSVLGTTAFAGNYADKGDVPQDNKDDGSHFYVNVGAAEYYFDQPSMMLPITSTTEDSYSADGWALSPSLAIGYQFLTDNTALQKIFGQQNAIELRASYFHNTGTQSENYDDQPNFAANHVITGAGAGNYGFDENVFDITSASVDFDNTYEDVGLYYTGNKVINNNLINSPYVGIDFSYLKQDSSYTTSEYFSDNTTGEPAGDAIVGTGSDDLSSYYMGLAFGDKMTALFANHFGTYGQLGAGVYWMHTKLDAEQTPATTLRDQLDGRNFPQILETFNLSTTDDQLTFKLNAEIGINYYFKNNQDPMSPYVTLLAGVDYWNDVAYAENPTQDGQAVQIGYDNAVNPYAGLQVHIPL